MEVIKELSKLFWNIYEIRGIHWTASEINWNYSKYLEFIVIWDWLAWTEFIWISGGMNSGIEIGSIRQILIC